MEGNSARAYLVIAASANICLSMRAAKNIRGTYSVVEGAVLGPKSQVGELEQVGVPAN